MYIFVNLSGLRRSRLSSSRLGRWSCRTSRYLAAMPPRLSATRPLRSSWCAVAWSCSPAPHLRAGRPWLAAARGSCAAYSHLTPPRGRDQRPPRFRRRQGRRGRWRQGRWSGRLPMRRRGGGQVARSRRPEPPLRASLSVRWPRFNGSGGGSACCVYQGHRPQWVVQCQRMAVASTATARSMAGCSQRTSPLQPSLSPSQMT